MVNGLVMHRHKAPAAITPRRLDSFYKKQTHLRQLNSKVTVISNEQGGLKQLLVGDVNTSPEKYSDQHPLLQNRRLPSRSEATVGQVGKAVDTGKSASASGAESEGLHTGVNDAKAQAREGELQEQAGADSSGYSTISLSVPVHDEQGNFLQPKTATVEPIVGTKRKGTYAASSVDQQGLHMLNLSASCLSLRRIL